MLAYDGHRVVSQEGRPSRNHLIEHGAKGVKVRPGRDVAAHGLLRRHVGDGTHHHAFSGKAGTVQGHRQAEVADLGDAILGHISRFQVPVDDSPTVGELHPPAGFLGDLDRLFQGKPVVRGAFNDPLNITAAHQFGDHLGLALFFSQVEDGDYVGVRAQAPHALGLPLDASPGGVVQTLGLNKGERYLSV